MKPVQAILLFLMLFGVSTLLQADGLSGGLFVEGSKPLALLLTGLLGIMLGTWNRNG